MSLTMDPVHSPHATEALGIQVHRGIAELILWVNYNVSDYAQLQSSQ